MLNPKAVHKTTLRNTYRNKENEASLSISVWSITSSMFHIRLQKGLVVKILLNNYAYIDYFNQIKCIFNGLHQMNYYDVYVCMFSLCCMHSQLLS